MTLSFVELGIDPSLVDILQRSNITEPTPVQAEAIPVVLGGRDLIATAPTGTGKTGAFLLPALQRLITDSKPGRGPRVLVLSPTRELAQQIGKAAKQFSEGLQRAKTVTITGGESYIQQNKVLARGYEILIATPGRLIDQLSSDRIDLSRVEMFVLDEADRMLDIGFTDAVLEIAGKLPEAHQTVCFTATMSPEVTQLANRLLKSPHIIDVGGDTHSSENITQRLIYVDHLGHKKDLLQHFLGGEEVTGQAIVFTATKRDADELAAALSDSGHPAIALHGDLSQKERTRSLNRLRSGESRVLVATDVAARGIDVSGISHVFNFDLPKFAEDYVHRIGRTGRAGASGIAVSFVGRTDVHALRRIERFVGQPIQETKIEGMESHFRPDQRGGPSRGAPRNDRGPARGRGGYQGRPAQGAGRGDSRGEGRSDSRGPRTDWKPAGDSRGPARGEGRPARAADDRQPRFNDDRQPRFNDDRQPRFNTDSRQPRAAGEFRPRAAQGDRQPRFNDDRQPRFNDDRQPRHNTDSRTDSRPDSRQPRAAGEYRPRPAGDDRQPRFNDNRGAGRGAAGDKPRGPRPQGAGTGQRAGAGQGPRTGQGPRAGGPGRTGTQGGYGKPQGRRPRQVGLYMPETPVARRDDWRNERLVDQKAKPKIVKVERKERPARAEGTTWTFTGKTLRLKKDGSED